MIVMKWLAVVLVIVGATILLLASYRIAPLTEVMSLSSNAEGTWQIPAEEVNQAFDEARKAMFAINNGAEWFKLAADTSNWLSFLCSAFIAAVLGWRGRQIPLAPGAPIDEQKLVGLPANWTGVIGLLAALATIFTVGGSQARAVAEAKFNLATQLNGEISDTARALDAVPPDKTRQREALDRLRMSVKRQ